MLARIEHILVSVLVGGFGAWMVFSGVHIGKADAFQRIDWGQAIAGMFIFLNGVWQFIRNTMAPGGEGLPVYRWAEYLIIVAVLAMMGAYFLLSSLGAKDWNGVTTGFVVVCGGVWAAIRKFPGRAS
jgi:hypothetical protein